MKFPRSVAPWLMRLVAVDAILIVVAFRESSLDWRSIMAVALFHLWFLAELGLERRSGSSNSAEADRGSRRLLTAIRDLSIIVPIARSATFPEPHWLFMLGLVVFSVGMGLRFRAMWWLGKRFTMSLTQQPQHDLVTAGPYRRMRHPGYLGLIHIFTSFSLICGEAATGLVLGLLSIAAVQYRIRLEEELLIRTFGMAYLDYRTRTWALLPKWAGSKWRMR